jgi:hypothetical protein
MWSRRVRRAGSALFPALLVGLSLQAYVRDDAAFGWGMFNRDVEYSIEYTRGGAPYAPGDELRGRARAIAGEPMHTRAGVGALRRWVRGYLRAHPGVEATLRYRVDGGPGRVERLP